MNTEEKKEIRFGLVLEPSLMKALDKFRSKFDNPPSRSEVIRLILRDRLQQEGILPQG